MRTFMKVASAVGALALLSLGSPAQAAVNLVTNGSFESSSYTRTTQFGAFFGGQGVTGWTGAGNKKLPWPLEFYFFGGTQTTVNALNQFGDPLAYFYDSFNTLSDDGGNFVGLDGDPMAAGLITQTINGLAIGQTYVLNFEYAASQLRNRKGATTEKLRVNFGSQTFDTAVLAVPSKGFSGWNDATFKFKATSTSQVLSFLSIGTPAGLPPIALLDGVSLTAVPEPATWGLMILGFAGAGVMIRSRRRQLAV